ncbi:membrane-associated tyrosine- and threonine-specific cdc2-inhibitory kinase [Nematocida homosporus]|uniref:membrane-associated tyrosine- and threonine-specific cdc2-inhibitory kinase n=1 Tax=Nematocida homosporus TaxID=1912981 RepID=UPI00221E9711|nr:membrane-associated tyrosine- and threonine-specific cdc2-inhibitory kinase [Nematocida homosporus]KAI5186666.1 membrane-associated tyrosine- and threonine-specific cdc2-inhibitory kinase [Nematocida homosporus]
MSKHTNNKSNNTSLDLDIVLANNNEEYENTPITPRTPEKKHPFKYIENVETPFKLKISRNEIKSEIKEKDNKLLSIFQEIDGLEKDGEWFRKKRIGRKKKPLNLASSQAVSVIKDKIGICSIESYFQIHFSIKETLHSSNESFVYWVREKRAIDGLGSGQMCKYCLERMGLVLSGVGGGDMGGGDVLSGDLSSIGDIVIGDSKNQNQNQNQNQSGDSEGDGGGEMERVVKISRLQWATLEERRVRIREAKFLYRLRKCRNITRIRRAWEEMGMLYIEMEWCNNGTLKEFLKKNSYLSQKVLLSLAAQMINGLKAINRAKIVHLDIKPENIYLHRDKKRRILVKIGDFSISRPMEDRTEIEHDGDRLYMAPELLQNSCSAASDVYSLGLIFIEMFLCVGVPLKSIPWTKISTAQKKEIISKSKISLELYRLIKKMIDPNPSRRPTIQEVYLQMKEVRVSCSAPPTCKKDHTALVSPG